MEKIENLLQNLSQKEKELFKNGEHYNDSGSKTRRKVLELAKDIENGFFVEAGACMGTDTKLLEVCGWNGLLVEPSDGLYEWCKTTRKCLVENYFLVSESKENERISGLELPIFQLPQYIQGFSNNSGSYRTITFTSLAQKLNINKVDIFVLDVEGYELEVINGINFESIEITNFIIEHNSHKYSLDTLDGLMNSKGFINEGLVEKLSNLQSDYHYKKIN